LCSIHKREKERAQGPYIAATFTRPRIALPYDRQFRRTDTSGGAQRMGGAFFVRLMGKPGAIRRDPAGLESTHSAAPFAMLLDASAGA